MYKRQVETLGTTCSYNLQVGRSPVNAEFTEYFVFERKEGYCVHFATAAALMFRMYGVPSRYATGYILSLIHISTICCMILQT